MSTPRDAREAIVAAEQGWGAMLTHANALIADLRATVERQEQLLDDAKRLIDVLVCLPGECQEGWCSEAHAWLSKLSVATPTEGQT